MRLLVLLIIFFLWTLPSWAATHYVDATCGNVATYVPTTRACTGGSTTSRNTIAGGIALLSAGDTLYIRQGTYNEKIFVVDYHIPSGTSWSNPITIASAPGESATLNSMGIQTNLNGSNPSYLIFDRLTFNGQNLQFNFETVFLGGDSHHIRISNCTLIGSQNHNNALGMGGSAGLGNFFEILNSTMRDAEGYGIYSRTQNVIIDGNDIYNNGGYGIHSFYSGHNDISNNTIRNNHIHDNGALGAGGTGVISFGILLGNGSNNVAYNNVIRNQAHGGGVQIAFQGGTNNQVYSNTIYNNHGSDAISIDSTVVNSVIKNNIIYGNSGQINDISSGTVYGGNLCGSSGPGCQVVGNPGFVSPSANPPDLHIAAGSPANGAGTFLSLVPTDIEGLTRNNPPTIGAYEFAGASPPPNPGPGTLLAWWLADEGAGTSVADSSGNGHTCILTSAGWQIPGIIGPSGLLLNGSRSCQISNVTNLTPTAFALAVWLQGTVLPASGLACFYTTDDAIEVCIDGTGRPTFTVYTDNYHTITGPASVQDGGAHIVVASYHATDGQRLWVDEGQVAFAAPTGPITYPSGTLTQIGRYFTDNAYAYTGVIDQIRAYFGPLKQAAVTSLYNENVSVSGTSMTHSQFERANFAIGTVLATDVDIPAHDRTQAIALAVAIQRVGTQITQHFALECSRNGGAFTTLTNLFGSFGARIAPDSVVNMGDSVQVTLPTGGFTPVAGRAVADTINTGLTTVLNTGEQTQWRYTIDFGVDAVAGNTYDCRPEGFVASNYLNVKRITLVDPPSVFNLRGGNLRGVTLR